VLSLVARRAASAMRDVLRARPEGMKPLAYTPASAGSLPVCSTTESPARIAIRSISSSEIASTWPRMILLKAGCGMPRRFAVAAWLAPSRPA
jgi:hypothetical protein